MKIIVPATSANIGPGFDVLGVALDLYNTFEIKKSEQMDPEDLVIKSYKYAYKTKGKKPIPIRVKQTPQVPRSGGLGSSSTAVVAGVVAAIKNMDLELTDDLVLSIATEIEGHPDNVAPAIAGGLVSTVMADDKLYQSHLDINNKLIFTAIVPKYRVDTAEAREILPSMIQLQDGISNTSRLTLLLEGLKTGDMDRIRVGLVDKFHEPYRKNLVPEYSDVKKICADLGAPIYLSGAGPTLMAITDSSIKNQIIKAFKKQSIDVDVLELKPSKKGYELIE